MVKGELEIASSPAEEHRGKKQFKINMLRSDLRLNYCRVTHLKTQPKKVQSDTDGTQTK